LCKKTNVKEDGFAILITFNSINNGLPHKKIARQHLVPLIFARSIKRCHYGSLCKVHCTLNCSKLNQIFRKWIYRNPNFLLTSPELDGHVFPEGKAALFLFVGTLLQKFVPVFCNVMLKKLTFAEVL
jgi:hypothetical protein